jgi:hypothetical protein
MAAMVQALVVAAGVVGSQLVAVLRLQLVGTCLRLLQQVWRRHFDV